MDVYIDSPAQGDILEIVAYISNSLLAGQAASSIYREIKLKISELADFPEIYPIIDEEPYNRMKIRSFCVGNYRVFYLCDNETNCVHIIRVLYNRREWQNIIDITSAE